MKNIMLVKALILLPVICLTACSTQKTQALRSARFGNQTVLENYSVHSSTRRVALQTQGNSSTISPESLAELNAMIRAQGRVKNQQYVLTPNSELGVALATQLKEKLEQLGALSERITVLPMTSKEGTALDVISIAMVVDVPDCTLADPDAWTTDPYLALSNLGCANHANLARMVSNPVDLISPRTLGSANGQQAEQAVKRYQEGDTTEFIDIDFSDD